MRIVFFGPPGAGKGTVATELRRRFPLLAYLATGDLLRKHVAARRARTSEILRAMRAGELVDESIIEGLWLTEWSLEVVGDDYILDGFPRSLVQVDMLSSWTSRRGVGMLQGAVHFEVANSVVMSRLSGRRVCPGCSAVFNLVLLPPKIDGVCDACGNGLVARDDDSPEVIQRRLDVYAAQTSPMVEYFGERDRLLTVDASRGFVDVADEIVARFA